jgi:quercetin 2,3-dioxygenase
LSVRTGARVLGSVLAIGDKVIHSLAAGRHAYLALAGGAATVNGKRLNRADGIAVTEEAYVEINALQQTELVLVDTA